MVTRYMQGCYVKGRLLEHEIVRMLESKTKRDKETAIIRLDLLRDLEIIDEDKHSEIYDKIMGVDR